MNDLRYLTKSRFKSALECPTKLYYAGKGDYADDSKEDKFLSALAEGGYQVGELSTDGVAGQSALYLKLLNSTVRNPKKTLWDLMMKNVYSMKMQNVLYMDHQFQ